MLDVPCCSNCEQELLGSSHPCLCEMPSKEDVAAMVEYAAYVLHETSEAMKRMAGLAQTVYGAELLKHALEMEGAAKLAESWVPQVSGEVIDHE